MNFRLSFLALSILPAIAGEDLIPSAKSGLGDYSAKGGLDDYSAKRVIDIPKSSPPRSPWTFQYRISRRKAGAIKFDTGSSGLVVPGVFGANSFTTPPAIGPATGPFDRTYDNGFLRPGPRTPATGRTTDYGYDTPDQVQSDRLEFYADGGERRVITTSSDFSPTGWSDKEDWKNSFQLSLNKLSDFGNGWSIGPALQLSFTNIDGRQGGLNTLNATERRDIFDVRSTDQYDTTGLVLPTAPYLGSPGAVAPLVPVGPVNRTFDDTLRSTDIAVFSDSIEESLDVNLFGISIGADALYRSESRFYAGVGTGIVFNIVDWDAKRSDRLVQITNGGPPVEIASGDFRNSGTDLLFGLYLQGSVGYQINDSWSIEGNARYDWSESLRDSVGGSDFDVDLSGLSVGVGATFSF